MIRLSSVEKIIIAFLLFIVLMLTLRISYANNIRYAFLLWNLFLAWIPFQLSVTLTESANRNKWYSYFLLLSWLLFFPNALYIITDLIHLDESYGDVPVWYDAILLFTCSVTGLIMAFVSLFQVEAFLKKNISPRHTGKLVMAAIFLGSFGVYVGRFLRWNSWSIITKPQLLFSDISTHVLLPFHHYKIWGVTLLLTCLFSLLYFAIKKLPGVLNEPGNATE
jgi:uncharacterized membrane protein